MQLSFLIIDKLVLTLRDADFFLQFNPSEFRGNYGATSNNMKLVHWPLMGGLLHLVHRGGGLGGSLARPGLSSLYQM